MAVEEIPLQALHWGGQANVVATLDLENGLKATGDRERPLLSVVFGVRDKSKDNRAMYPLMGMVELRNGGQNSLPVSRSGWSPWGEPLYLPVPETAIERLADEADRDTEGRVTLRLKFAVILPLDETTKAQYPGASQLLVHFSQPIHLPIANGRWQTFLKVWGFPESRFVPLPLTLPPTVLAASPEARVYWDVVVDALQNAIEAQRAGDWMKAGQQLRRCADHLVLVWFMVWGGGPTLEDRMVAKAISFLDTAIPNCNAAAGQFPQSAEAQRACARWGLLRSLHRASQPMMHVGKVAVYTREDVDYLLTSLTALARTFPQFWAELPEPPGSTAGAV